MARTIYHLLFYTNGVLFFLDKIRINEVIYTHKAVGFILNSKSNSFDDTSYPKKSIIWIPNNFIKFKKEEFAEFLIEMKMNFNIYNTANFYPQYCCIIAIKSGKRYGKAIINNYYDENIIKKYIPNWIKIEKNLNNEDFEKMVEQLI